MLILIAKAPSIPIIQAGRLAIMGMQYNVVTPEGLDVVTANNERLICTYGDPACIHARTVQHQQACNAAVNAYMIPTPCCLI